MPICNLRRRGAGVSLRTDTFFTIIRVSPLGKDGIRIARLWAGEEAGVVEESLLILIGYNVPR